uniref:Uncharacterized protein n=1 Tax=Parascaris equorum TaxID=6256 RepID=A0A914SDP8_PAREQ
MRECPTAHNVTVQNSVLKDTVTVAQNRILSMANKPARSNSSDQLTTTLISTTTQCSGFYITPNKQATRVHSHP